ncbi:MAG: hypothetical protein U1F98_10070 [Verrucomicrobiota bacterium]
MQFLKKNYEKILLGVVLFGLVAGVAFLPFQIDSEKTQLAEKRTSIINTQVKPIPDLDLSRSKAALQQGETPVSLDLASSNKLFNPVRWQKTSATGQIFKNPQGSELERLQITGITPLHLVISLETVNASDSGVRYGISVEAQAAAKKAQQMKKTFYVTVNEKKDAFALREVKGQPDNPSSLTIELADSGEQASITREKPFKRVDGYMADLKYLPDGRTYMNRRVGDKVVVGGEPYNIVAITQNEVVFSAPNGKKYSRPYNAVP